MWKSWYKWTQILRILGREGADVWVLRNLFKAIFQAVFLFGYYTGVLTPRMSQTLGGFQISMACCMAGKKSRRLPGGGWEYPPPPFGETMQDVDMEEVEE